MSELSEFIKQLNKMRQDKSNLMKTVKYPKLLVSGLQELEKMVGMLGLKSQIINQIKFLLVTEHRRLNKIKEVTVEATGLKNISENYASTESQDNNQQSSLISNLRNQILQSTLTPPTATTITSTTATTITSTTATTITSTTATETTSKGKMEGHMLHALLCGNPGTGKTTVAKILCKIWIALDLLKNPKSKPIPTPPPTNGGCCPPPVLQNIFVPSVPPTPVPLTPPIIHAELLRSQISNRILEIEIDIKNSKLDILKKNIRSDLEYLRDVQNKINRKRAKYSHNKNDKSVDSNKYHNRISSLLESNKQKDKDSLFDLDDVSKDLRSLNYRIDSHLEDNNDEKQSSSSKNPQLLASKRPVVTINSHYRPPMPSAVDDNYFSRQNTEIIPYFNILPQTPILPQIPIEPEYIEEEPPKDEDLPFKIITRENLVAKYVGQTAPLTMETLNSCLGHVVLIDEAYLLYHNQNSGDSFGMEALTLINEFMSKHAGEIIIIFAGYKDLMKETIFKAQPGLQRRCGWTFEINAYSPSELAEIFTRQLARDNWEIKMVSILDEEQKQKDIEEQKQKDIEEQKQKDIEEQKQKDIEEQKQKDITNMENFVNNVLNTDDTIIVEQPTELEHQKKKGLKRKREVKQTLNDFFEKHINSFKNGAGDTERLAYNAKLAHASYSYSCITENKPIPDFIDLDMLKIAFTTLTKSNEHTGSEEDKFAKPNLSMYA
jgi:hypothetical protein